MKKRLINTILLGAILAVFTGCSEENIVENNEAYSEYMLKATGLTNNSIYTIEPQTNSNKVLDLKNGIDANGTPIRPWDKNGSTSQQWKAVYAGNGYWRFISVASSSNRCIDSQNGSTANGTSIRLWDNYNNDAQAWLVTDAGNGYYKITPKLNSSKSWDVPYCNMDGTANLQLWDYYGTSCQLFKFNLLGSDDDSNSGDSPNPSPLWTADARCFLDGPSGAFDDIAVKDPSIVYSGGKYHLFYTGKDNSLWRMGYASATSISGLGSATHNFMSSLNGGYYFCAPQVFYFVAKGKWYLIYQSGLGATFSTNTDVGNPSGWSAGASMGFSDGIDFWCISDGSMVYCFYSAQDGSHTIKRRSTTITNFPYGWSSSTVVATNTFEASHVYKNLEDGKYYMIVEDLGRYQELWSATSPGGTWTKVSEQWAIASRLSYNADHWTDQVSHIEVIRAGSNELLEVNNLNQCEMLIQGVVNGNYPQYGLIPYDLGIIRNY
jgi:hypothetical protein